MRGWHLHDAALWTLALSALFVAVVWTLAAGERITFLGAGLITGLVALLNLRELRIRHVIRTAYRLGYRAGARDRMRNDRTS